MSDEFGADTKTEYYNNGTILATIDAENHRTEYQYDENNRRTEIIKTVNGAKFTEEVIYDEVGNICFSIDGENRTTESKHPQIPLEKLLVTYITTSSDRQSSQILWD